MMPDTGGKPLLPFRAEYAKSGRSTCKMCYTKIPKKELRIAALTHSTRFEGIQPDYHPFIYFFEKYRPRKRFDGVQANWHHVTCFFKKYRPKNTEEIENFEAITVNDQTKIEKKIDELYSSGMSPGKTDLISDFRVEYPKSSNSHCLICTKGIEENEPRIGRIDHESEIARRIGPIPRWHHVTCFAETRNEIGFTASGEELEGFSQLEKADQEKVLQQLPKIATPLTKKTKGRKNPSAKKSISKKSKPRTSAKREEKTFLEEHVRHSGGKKKSNRSNKLRRAAKTTSVGRGRKGGGEKVREPSLKSF